MMDVGMLEMLIYTSISAGLKYRRGQHDWYVTRVAVYKRFDWQGLGDRCQGNDRWCNAIR
jgi:hypothetical protein